MFDKLFVSGQTSITITPKESSTYAFALEKTGKCRNIRFLVPQRGLVYARIEK